MKKVLLFVAMAMISTGAFAQTTFNVKAGMNVSTFMGDDNAKAKVGFKGGVGADIQMSDILYLQPSLYFAMKGAHYDAFNIGNLSGDIDVNAMYLELPIMVAAKIYLGGNTNFNVGLGPYIAYGIGGKTKFSGSFGSLSGGTERDTFHKDAGFKNRFDAGLGLIVGVEFGRFLVGADVQMGLVKLNPQFANVTLNENTKNMTFSIGIGYQF